MLMRDSLGIVLLGAETPPSLTTLYLNRVYGDTAMLVWAFSAMA